LEARRDFQGGGESRAGRGPRGCDRGGARRGGERELRGGRKTREGRERGLLGGVLGVRRGFQEGVRHKL
jgi:hypothetical protein